MATEVFMPKLSMTMETGTILQWFKQEGDDVKEGDLLLEVMTDKINIEVESYASGKLLKIYYGADEVVPVNQVIGYIGAEGEQVPDSPPPVEGSAGAKDGAAAETACDASTGQACEAAEAADDTAGEKVRATPAARRIARENGISLHKVTGTGERGRIHQADVLRYLADNRQAEVKATPLAQKIAAAEGIALGDVAGTGVQGKVRKDDVLAHQRAAAASVPAAGEQVKLDGMRKVIAQRMVQSAFTAPHVTLVSEVDMSAAIAMRQALLPVVENKTGLRLSYTEIIMKAVAYALREHPKVNASLQGDYIALHPQVNIGLAVAVPNGLVVPVVKQADQQGLADLTAACKQLASLARDNKLLPEHMSGGTFTISNLGMYSIDAFTPIINQPESAILGVGRIHEKPVGVGGEIVLRPMMTLSLSFDHRVIDGAPAAAFLQTVKEVLENPYQMMV
ncbi:dihydrolipoamide acetyltransferase family protein [Brevibacillus massiliensis]|uniref:dihydrolipoamide acetyltransferase family protein n=1 Tax=Brevibacillus massiliensis TaxID=1118054 RepID=UPI0002F6249E|nr:dihydrolipoamide acetyltransferase family protein [Brevibacillus massiliensis]